jgi:hypothetical protein
MLRLRLPNKALVERPSGKWRNGRRARFRSVCPNGRGGSTPPLPTLRGPGFRGRKRLGRIRVPPACSPMPRQRGLAGPGTAIPHVRDLPSSAVRLARLFTTPPHSLGMAVRAHVQGQGKGHGHVCVQGAVALVCLRCRHTDRMISAMSSSSTATAGALVPREVIAVSVRWHLRFGLSYRDLGQLRSERGIKFGHVTVHPWVQVARPSPRSSVSGPPMRAWLCRVVVLVGGCAAPTSWD